MPIVNRIAEFEPELIEWRHHLHSFPELGFEEYKTSDFVAEKLSQMGLEVNRGLAGTGVVATLTAGSGNGPKIGLRADMDALPIMERSKLDHASKNPGVMHACGHDVIQRCCWVRPNISLRPKILTALCSLSFSLLKRVKAGVKK